MLSAIDLKRIYKLLRGADSLTVEQVAEASDLSDEQVDAARKILISAGLAKDGKDPPLGDRRFTTKL